MSGPAPPAKVAAASPSVRSGTVEDRGVMRRDSVHAARWLVDGSAKATGAVDVGSLEVQGSLSVGGMLSADTLTVRGRLDAGAAVQVAGALTSDGGFRATGPVTARQATFDGASRVTGDVTVEATLALRGQFAAAALHVGELRGDGAVQVVGELRAGAVDLRLKGESRFGVIRARSVRLLRASANPVEMVLGGGVPTPVERIEADRVELEGVDADFVHCPEVILGRDAHISELEGTVVRQHGSASVGPRSKTPPPYGLSR